MKRTLAMTVCFALCLGVPQASALSFNFGTIKGFKRVLPAVQDTTGVPIRIPRSVKLESADSSQTIYVSGSGSASRYSLEIAYAPNCGNATACFGANFTGRRGNHLSGGQVVSLGKLGLKGRFFPTRCGASCAKPQIQWFQNGVTYTLQLAVSGPERQSLVKLANAAIRAPRL